VYSSKFCPGFRQIELTHRLFHEFVRLIWMHNLSIHTSKEVVIRLQVKYR